MAQSGDDAFEALLARSNLTRRQLLLYIGQHAAGVLLYDAVWAVPLRNLDPGTFQDAFQTMVDSADALRTVVEEPDGVPRQRVLPALSFRVPCVDLRAGSDPSRADDWIDQRCRVPFVPAARLFDTALLQIGDRDYIWYLNLHHVVADGWAGGLVIQGVWELYKRARRGERPEVLTLPSFQAHVERIRAAWIEPAYRDDEAYWRERLDSGCDVPPFYGRAPIGRSTAKIRIRIDLGPALTTRLQALAARDDVFVKNQDATMTNVWAALLLAYAYRTSAARRLAVGVAFHNRVSPEDRALVGLLMEVLPFVVTVDPSESFLSFVRRVGREARDALAHRAYSVGNSAQAPVYDLFLNSIRTIPIDPDLGPVARVFPGHGETTISVTLEDAASSGHLRVYVDVKRDLVESLGAEALTQHFLTLVDAAVSRPDRAVGLLPIASAAERDRIAGWSGTGAPCRDAECLHSLVEAQVARTPHAVAIVCGEERVTYEALDRRANQLAHHIRSIGVGVETLVGLCMARGVDQIVALLAVLKAGGAYVPLDPAYPIERLRYMLDDARVRVVITHASLRPLFARDVRCVCVDADKAAIEAAPAVRPQSEVGPDNLAYVMYTSGSTGHPKGVAIEHRSVCNYLRWRASYFPLAPADALLQSASISFDDSVWEILEPLSAGARLVLVESGRERDVSDLADLIIHHRVTAACFVPSQLQAFLDSPGAADCRTLRRVTTGGEKLSRTLTRRFFQVLPAARLYNGYGPTETTISATFWACRTDDGDDVPIGRPIANVDVHVLDHDQQVTPVGVPGEIYIGGAGLARGYLNQPAPTTDRFVPHPFSADPAARLYRTGDRGCWRSDGQLEFRGRLDDQVKLRGFRIELGEVETALRTHGGVKDAVVVLRDEPPVPPRLVAYVVPSSGAGPSARELRAALGRTLPAYMRPAAFVTLDRLPIGPGGKVDRRGLPAPPDVHRRDADVLAAPPRTAVETMLTQTFAEVLGVDRVGVHDDFFELGGDSLLAIELFRRIEARCGQRLPLSTLFDGATVAALAGALASPPARGAVLTVAIQPNGTRPPLFLLPSVTGDLLHWRELVRHLGDDQPCYGFQVPEVDAMPDSESRGSIPDLAALCVTALRRSHPHGPYALAGFSFGGVLAFELARQLVTRGDQVSCVAIVDTGVTAAGSAPTPSVPRRVWSFVRNAFWWTTDDLLRSDPRKAGARFSRQARSIGRRLRRVRGGTGGWLGRRDAGDIWDLERLTGSTRRTIETRFEALRAYAPARYAGSAVLFRARAQPLLVPGPAPDLGWTAVCEDVAVEVIPGSHDTILREPSVRVLADRLRTRLHGPAR